MLLGLPPERAFNLGSLQIPPLCASPSLERSSSVTRGGAIAPSQRLKESSPFLTTPNNLDTIRRMHSRARREAPCAAQ